MAKKYVKIFNEEGDILMSKMVRKQVYIESKQENRLKKMAKEIGVSEAELIRQGINRCFERPVELPHDFSAWNDI